VKRVLLTVVLVGLSSAVVMYAQRQPFVPVSEEMLLKPSPDDWLMYSRTYDAQRFSPLNQITTKNVGQLREVFKRELPAGVQESIPIVYRGVMYMLLPGNGVRALDAATGALIWEHVRPAGGASRAKTISIYEDMIFNSTPDGVIEALDARTGEMRWETKSSGRLTAGTIVIEGKVITGRACAPRQRGPCQAATIRSAA
jgi:glucose dehydrogenase